MADIQNEIAGASQDFQTIEDFVNLPAGSDVRPRLLPSVNVGTLSGTRDAIFEAGGLPATPFATKPLMEASALVDGKYAMVTDDTINNGLYVKTSGAWVKSGYDPIGYTNKTVQLEIDKNTARLDIYKNKLDDSSARDGYLLNSSTGAVSGEGTTDGWGISDYIPIKPDTYYTISGSGERRISLFNSKEDGKPALLTQSITLPYTIKTPVNSAYLVVVLYSPYGVIHGDIQIEEGEFATKYVKRGVIGVADIDGNELGEFVASNTPVKDYEIVSEQVNLFDKSSVRHGFYMNSALPTSIRPMDGWAVSDFIKLEANQEYTISGQRALNRFAVFQTKDGTNSVINQNPSSIPVTFTSPDYTSYLVLSLESNTLKGYSNVQVEKGDIATEYSEHKPSITIDPKFISGGVELNKPKVSINGNTLEFTSPSGTQVTMSYSANVSFNSSTAVNFKQAAISGSVFSQMNDDIAPYYIENTLAVGANHGYFKVEVTSTSHGKSVADIGSVWTDGGKRLVLFATPDEDTLYLTTEDNASPNLSSSSLTHVSDAANSASIVVESQKTTQMFPVFKNHKVELIVDNHRISMADGEVGYDKFATIAESYDVMLKKDIVDYIKSNKGTLITEFDAEAVMRVCINYTFDVDAGCTMNHVVYFLKDTTVRALPMLQNILPSGANYYMPDASPVAINGSLVDFGTPVDLRQVNISATDININQDGLRDVSKPVGRAVMSKGVDYFATGFLPVADTTNDKRLSNAPAYHWRIRGDSLKTYAQVVSFDQYMSVSKGSYYSTIAYKKWKRADSSATYSYAVRTGGADYFYIDVHAVGDYFIPVPVDYVSRGFEVLSTSGDINVKSDIAQQDIVVDCKALDSSHAYIVLKMI